MDYYQDNIFELWLKDGNYTVDDSSYADSFMGLNDIFDMGMQENVLEDGDKDNSEDGLFNNMEMLENVLENDDIETDGGLNKFIY